MNYFKLLHDSFNNTGAGEAEILTACEALGLTTTERWLFAVERGRIDIEAREYEWSNSIWESERYALEVMVCAALDDTAAVEYRLRFGDEPTK